MCYNLRNFTKFYKTIADLQFGIGFLLFPLLVSSFFLFLSVLAPLYPRERPVRGAASLGKANSLWITADRGPCERGASGLLIPRLFSAISGLVRVYASDLPYVFFVFRSIL